MASDPICPQPKPVVEHIPGLLTIHSDGSFDRPTDLDLPACPQFVGGVASKDVVVDSATRVWARIFLPQLLAEGKEETTRMPVVLHFHGGGFCFGSPATPYFHQFCSRMAVKSRCIWISVHYRLAPENPLPAAFDDAYAALSWLHSQASVPGGHSSGAEPWLAQHADFTSCFCAGESAGGTIVHFLAARAAAQDWSPVRIKGLLMIHGGYFQTKPKQIEGLKKGDLSLDRLELYRRASLPPDSPWDHPYLNPLHSDWPKLSEINLPPAFVAVAERDLLREGAEIYYEELTKAGNEAEFFSSEGKIHCFHLHPPPSAASELLENKMIKFILKRARL